jgi:hypothetical protein
MSNCNCHDQKSNRAGNTSPPSPPMRSRTLLRRGIALLNWLAPAVTLTLIPKCPMCLAAYVALGTGIGISVSTASFLRIALIGLCLAALIYPACRKLRALHRKTI